MRKSFITTLIKIAEQDSSCYLLVGDVGYSVIEPFIEKFPDRYINTGIAEQNMVGVAAGLALAGKRVYVYSITPFACMRPFEQIRNDLCYQQLPVTIVGNGSGFSYAQAGATHHAVEDIAIMRALPEMLVVAPGSAYELTSLMPQLHRQQQPIYLRLGAAEGEICYPDKPIQLGSPIELLPSDQALLLATGSALAQGWNLVTDLRAQGYEIGLVSVPVLKPLNITEILENKKISTLITLEEHSLIGGLGMAVAYEIAQKNDRKIIFKAFGLTDHYPHHAGSRAFLNSQHGLDNDYLLTEIEKLLIHKPVAFTPINPFTYEMRP